MPPFRCIRSPVHLNCPVGYVTHATDRPLWAFLLPALTGDQVAVARNWLEAIDRETTTLEDAPKRDVKDVLVLTEDRKIEWREDGRWESIMKLRGAVPGEQ